MYKIVIAILTAAIFLSCGAGKKDLIIGKWKEVETGSAVSEYKADGTYFITFDDGTTEEGTYRVDGNKLFNTVKGESEELSVELTTLDDKNLVQNIAGQFQTKYVRIP